jgi:NADPH2:quinone reductase
MEVYQTMQAVVLQEEIGPDGLAAVERPEPTPKADEVLIDVQAAGVSFVDLLMSRGQYQERPDVPFVPGVEVAGLVRSAPSDSGLHAGDRVAAYILNGGYAEVVAAPAATTFALPPGLDFAAGTALALNYQTAHFALVRRGRLAAGEVVLVHGAAGGVGVAAVQLAKALGAMVIATVRSESKAAIARAAGADHVLTTDDGWASAIREMARGGVHLVVDPVGGPLFDDSLRTLAPEGRYLVVGFAGGGIPTVRANRILLRNVDVVGVGWGAFLSTDSSIVTAAAASFASMAGAGFIAPPIGELYPLADAARALRDLESHQADGKLVLEVGGRR